MIPVAKLSLAEAKRQCRCRICGTPILIPRGSPLGWQEEFGKMIYPVRIVLDFGAEFAHVACLDAEGRKHDG